MGAKSWIGNVIADSYYILAVAGAGGMGTVFKARQIGLERLVALKIHDPIQDNDEDLLKRFEREAKSISQLSHAHISAFYSFGVTEDSIPYIVMEWIEGRSLLDLIEKDGKMPGERAAKIAAQISEALSYAHNHGIVHRDLKPANILLVDKPEPDFVKIVDFGLARMVDMSDSQSQRLTKTGTVLGTPQYLSPEQCLGRRADARSDIYALGCILYEMVCGDPPFLSDNPLSIIHKHVNEIAVYPTKKNSGKLPEGLESIILKCLEKEPEKRYQSMSDLNADLLAVIQGQKVSIEERKVSGERNPVIAALLTAAVALCVGGLLVAFWLNSDAGICTQADLMLHRDNTERNVTYWQDRAEKLEKEGKSDLSLKINESIDRAMSIGTMEPTQAIKVCIKLAQDLKLKGDNHSSAKFAMTVIKVGDLFCERRADSRHEILDDLETAASILSDLNYELDDKESKTLFSVADMESDFLIEDTKDKLVNLALSPLCRRVGPKGPMLGCLYTRDIVLAKRGDIAAMKDAVAQDLAITRKLKGKQSLRVPDLYANLAKELSMAKHYDEAREYVDESCAMIEDKKGTVADMGLATIWRMNSATYLRLHENEKALDCAKKSLFRGMEDNEGAKCYIQYVTALAACGNLKEAEAEGLKVHEFAKTLKFGRLGRQFMDSVMRIKYELVGTRVDSATILYEIELRLNQTAKAKELLQEERQELEQYLPGSAKYLDDLNRHVDKIDRNIRKNNRRN